MANEGKEKSAWTRLPEDWAPSLELLNWARQKRSDLTETEIQDETENFVEHWSNKRGKDAEKKDWNRAFQTWMRRAIPRRPGFRPLNNNNGGVVV